MRNRLINWFAPLLAALSGLLMLLPTVTVFADGGEGEGGEGEGEGEGEDAGESGAEGGEGESGESGSGGSKTLTQADVDAAIAKRLKTEKAKWEAEAQAAADREKMDAAEKAQAEKADAEKARDEAIARANKTLVSARAESTALAAGVKPERVAAFLRHVDTDDVEVGDDGKVDAKAVKAAVDAALKEVPEFKAGTGTGRSGGELNGGGGDKEPKTLEDAVNAAMAGR